MLFFCSDDRSYEGRDMVVEFIFMYCCSVLLLCLVCFGCVCVDVCSHSENERTIVVKKQIYDVTASKTIDER